MRSRTLRTTGNGCLETLEACTPVWPRRASPSTSKAQRMPWESSTAWTRIRGTIDIDIDRLTVTSHALSFHVTALWQTGDNVGAKLASYANPSSIASVPVFRMDSYWLQKPCADGIAGGASGRSGLEPWPGCDVRL
jgi:hypothetical protein